MPTKQYGWGLKLLVGASVVWMILLCALIVCADLLSPQALLLLDYHTSFHVAGWLVNNEQAWRLYPPAGAITFQGAPFDVTTHRFLPTIDKNIVAEFMYCPVVAFIFAPLSNLLPNIGLLIWQSISFVCLASSAFFLAATGIGVSTDSLRTPESTGLDAAVTEEGLTGDPTGSGTGALGSRSKLATRTGLVAGSILACAFLFFPVFNTLWLGQLDIVLGLLPLSFGCFLLARKQGLFAGLVWSVMFLKPQFLPAAGLLCLGCLFRKNYKPLVGLVLGVLLLFGACFVLTSRDIVFNWLASLQLSEGLFTGQIRNPEYLVGSLPGALVISFPNDQRLALKPAIYAIAFVLGLAALWLVWKLARSKLEETDWLSLNTIVSTLSLIVFSPRLLTYDWSFFVAAITLATLRFGHQKRLLVPVLSVAAFVNVEIFLQLSNLGKTNPLLLTLASTISLLVFARNLLLFLRGS